ncbi:MULTISPECIES: acyl-CoA dehydrogenase family protein [unclassified Sphingopyxis]|uniref:acyl-CoA dehydrogenase family protein n=1 Tax=unclassified Sphingopyxis TaxID=2614943 RepID=UPI00073119BE|nr:MULTISPECIES: acyl-CoA dehydrogenase family protein [unclassified Sphingopyxis]KTE25091.1 acyl-CoA dehydrogenase [Sphingopyxis sp. H057]KTE53660.1 acyl-CoA dehydrogenase [Sphingopyxis sp. H073]KTE56253.1 acyl-CoA dehydrogenase [Sphingopyxis sp. H071]KTE61946.1 acyl-CoA dehydrogenase [Sphingopyxis sp. H107]KTE67219.1 acyl-CoA dehydrogenase [Sphingopyxis sp. H100]
MSDLEAYRARAATWLESMVPAFGKAARKGLSEADDLALARRYQAAKFEAGYAGINWPVEYGGQGLGHLEKVTFDSEEMKHGFPNAYFGISLGMPVPILMQFGEDKAFVKERVLKALRGEEIWCQLFSEPAGGSDLAGLRTKAEPDGNGWKINGQKVWTSWAQYSDYGVIVVRTDPNVPKHKGLTYFWVDMKAPGVTVRPIRLAGGDSHVNEVFFDDVKVDDDHRMSPVGGGFAVAMATLMIERYVATDSGGFGPHLDLFVELAKATLINGKPAIADGRIRQQIARNYAMRNGLNSITARAMAMMQAGMVPGPEGSLNKLVSVRSRQKLSELAIDLQGNDGFAFDDHASQKEDWTSSWINAPTGRIAGGADEMLLNTIAEKILGLPQDHRPDKGVPFNQIPA